MPTESLDELADRIPRPESWGRNVFVAVNGVDGAGKTCFASGLAIALDRSGWPVISVGLGDFHKPRAERYRLGRNSAVGFWLDSYDYSAFLQKVVAPLKPDGTSVCIPKHHDVESDELLQAEPIAVNVPSVVLVEGMFLHRDELVHIRDFSIFLDVEFENSLARLAARDGSDPEALTNQRYVQGQRIYFKKSTPKDRASLVIDYNDPQRPRWRAPSS